MASKGAKLLVSDEHRLHLRQLPTGTTRDVATAWLTQSFGVQPLHVSTTAAVPGDRFGRYECVVTFADVSTALATKMMSDAMRDYDPSGPCFEAYNDAAEGFAQAKTSRKSGAKAAMSRGRGCSCCAFREISMCNLVLLSRVWNT